ncbi:OprO/OprP family phosphate-selective porin [Sphingobium yanoikuyae]|uniref:OprO/OprP family phosphate-selective porin n=1 Tax=Sphingobium yanoikuyae TaxID=13690 RepID=UPI0022DCEE3B|nr:porin [Sphingobium yanoikuyae]WBQ19176.1 porin [Sphingobium yanoikuyae]
MSLLLTGALPAAAMAQHDDEIVELRQMVKSQQVEIEALKRRLDQMDSGQATNLPPSAQASHSSSKVVQSSAPLPKLGYAQPSDAHPQALDARLARIESAQIKAVLVDWSKGSPEFSTADGSLTFRPRGRVLMDLGATMGSNNGARNIVATQTRSVRLGVEGAIGRNLSYVVEGDFADNDVTVKSAYLAWTTRVVGHQAEFALGNRLNDRGLDGSSGTISVPFIERNLVAQAIIPVRGFFGMGAAARLYGDNWHLGLQLSGDDINNPGTSSDSLTLGGRAHWNPVRTDMLIVHLGAWAFYEKLAHDVARPTRAVAIGGFFNDNLRVASGTFLNPRKGAGYGFELGLIKTSLWAYGEYGSRQLEASLGRETRQEAWALAAGWFLTGDTPPYLARGGVWSRPKVKSSFTRGGTGALELALRYEGVDYSDNPTAGRGKALTAGVNWYLNNFTRLQFNAIDWTVENPLTDGTRPSDKGQTVVGRAQIAF